MVKYDQEQILIKSKKYKKHSNKKKTRRNKIKFKKNFIRKTIKNKKLIQI